MKHKMILIFSGLPVRYLICILGSVGLGIIYGLKVNFHVAMVSMLNYTAVGGSEHGEGEETEVSVNHHELLV